MKNETANTSEKAKSVPPVDLPRKRRTWTFSVQMWETLDSNGAYRLPFVYSYTQHFVVAVPREYALCGFTGVAHLFAERHSFTFNPEEIR